MATKKNTEDIKNQFIWMVQDQFTANSGIRYSFYIYNSIMINLTTWPNNKILCLFVYLVAWLLWQQPYQRRKSKTKEKPCGQGWGQQQDLHQKQYVPHQYSFALYIVIAYLNIVKVRVLSRDQFRARY